VSVVVTRAIGTATTTFTHPIPLGLMFGGADRAVIIGVGALKASGGSGEEFGAINGIVVVGIGSAGHAHAPSFTPFTATATAMPHPVATMATTTAFTGIVIITIIGASSAVLGHLRMMRVPFGAADAAVTVAVHRGEHLTMTARAGRRAILRGQPAVAVGIHPGKASGGRSLCLCTRDVAVIIGIGGRRTVAGAAGLGNGDTTGGQRNGGGTNGEFCDSLHGFNLL
jgi:hypothetical protein